MGMKYYTPQHKQLTLDLVRSSLDNLDKFNRWVRMGDLLPWADIEKEYNSRLDNKEQGAGNKPARMVDRCDDGKAQTRPFRSGDDRNHP